MVEAVVADVATYEAPARFPIGIDDVIVNGRLAVEGGRDRRASGSSVAARRVTRTARTGAMEAPAIAELPGGRCPTPFATRRGRGRRGWSSTPTVGLIVTLPATRSTQRDGERRRPRSSASARHGCVATDRQAALDPRLAARGGARDGGAVPFRGRLHRVRVVPAVSGARRSDVVAFDDELVIHRVGRDRRPDGAILEAWLRGEARRAVDAAVADHAVALGVSPVSVTMRDPRTRWGALRAGRCRSRGAWLWRRPRRWRPSRHELAHLRMFGHGPRFWALSRRRPDYLLRRRWLHDHATELHRALATD